MADYGQSKITRDHDTIREWAESRGGRPAKVKGTGGNDDVGMIRVMFPGREGQKSLEEISWEDFFAEFDDKNLTFLYQDQTREGAQSRFFKFIRQ